LLSEKANKRKQKREKKKKKKCFGQAPVKRSQHFNPTHRDVPGRSMPRAPGHPVATCCGMLGVVGSNLKMVKFFMQHLWMLYEVVVVWPGSCNNVAPGHAH